MCALRQDCMHAPPMHSIARHRSTVMIVHKDKNKNAAFSLNSIWKNSPTTDQGGEFVESCGPGCASSRCFGQWFWPNSGRRAWLGSQDCGKMESFCGLRIYMYIRPATSATFPWSGYPGVVEDNASFAYHVCRIPPMCKAMVVLDSPSEKAVGVWGLLFSI